RRQDIISEANFYGAMDGSSKFIKGDAVAGIIITIINIIGGFLIGAFQHDMEIKDAAATYTILTIGDGLVSQIPGLITSTATAIIITRASKDEDNFAEGVVNQLLGEYKTLLIVGFILFVFALVPGLPTFSLGFMGLLFLGIGFILKMIEEGKIDFSAVKTDKNSSQQAGNGNKAAPSANKLPKKSEEEIALEEQAKIDDILKIEILELDLGYGLLKLADGDLVERIRAMRRNMATMLGFLMPKIRLRDNILLGPNEYKFKLKGVVIGSGVVYPDKCLAMDSGYVSADIDGIAVKDPAFGLDALWIDQNYKEDAILSGYTVADAASVISTHMSELVKQNASELLTKQEVQNILEKVKSEYSVVVDDALKIVGVGVIQKVLKALLKDNIPIKDMLSILEAISDVAEVSKNLDMIIEHVRAALARVITSIYTDENGQLNFYILEAPAQQKLIDSLSYKDGAYTLMINVAQTSAIVSALRAKRENRPISEQGDMVLCVEPSIRKFIANIVQNFSIDIAVLSFAEIAPNTQFETLGTIEIPEL
ncbi:MAG: FHIPEP family type III secretion protein, partial [Campylobacter sp.]|nr:FHIPEP family type III secretion protein [Campylobacter sp.]